MKKYKDILLVLNTKEVDKKELIISSKTKSIYNNTCI